jgi:acetate---CoA ligase (ADP-forming)
LLEYFLRDDQTRIIFLHLESLSRGRELFELAAAADKPIVIHKANISPLSREIAKSHTHSLAGDDLVADCAFRQAGMIRVRSYDELLDCVKVLLLPRLCGNRLAVVSRAGGVCVALADECHRNGFELPALSRTFHDWLKNQGRAGVISPTNPVDLGDIYDLDLYPEVFRKLLDEPQIDGIFYDVCYTPRPDQIDFHVKTFSFLHQINQRTTKPVFMSTPMSDPKVDGDLHRMLSFPYFNSSVAGLEALGKVMKAGKPRQRMPL